MGRSQEARPAPVACCWRPLTRRVCVCSRRRLLLGMRAYPRLLPAEQKAWQHILSWAARRGMWLAAFIAFVTALILVLVHGFQREDLVPLVVLLCVVVAAYAFRLQQTYASLPATALDCVPARAAPASRCPLEPGRARYHVPEVPRARVSELSFHGCSASVESLEYFSRCLPMRVSRAATFPETLLSPWASTSLSLLAPIVAGEP
jgi:hypothetical protein